MHRSRNSYLGNSHRTRGSREFASVSANCNPYRAERTAVSHAASAHEPCKSGALINHALTDPRRSLLTARFPVDTARPNRKLTSPPGLRHSARWSEDAIKYVLHRIYLSLRALSTHTHTHARTHTRHHSYGRRNFARGHFIGIKSTPSSADRRFHSLDVYQQSYQKPNTKCVLSVSFVVCRRARRRAFSAFARATIFFLFISFSHTFFFFFFILHPHRPLHTPRSCAGSCFSIFRPTGSPPRSLAGGFLAGKARALATPATAFIPACTVNGRRRILRLYVRICMYARVRVRVCIGEWTMCTRLGAACTSGAMYSCRVMPKRSEAIYAALKRRERAGFYCLDGVSAVSPLSRGTTRPSQAGEVRELRSTKRTSQCEGAKWRTGGTGGGG